MRHKKELVAVILAVVVTVGIVLALIPASTEPYPLLQKTGRIIEIEVLQSYNDTITIIHFINDTPLTINGNYTNVLGIGKLYRIEYREISNGHYQIENIVQLDY